MPLRQIRIFCCLILPVVMLIMLVSGVSSQEVLISVGGYTESGAGSVSWSIGEPVIETLSGTGGVMTQGMQQPNAVASVVAEPVPTLGEWGLLICMMLFLIVSVVALRDEEELMRISELNLRKKKKE